MKAETPPIRVLLADDHALVRAGIRSLLQGLDGIEVVGEAGDGHETLRLAAKLRPDIVLLDIGMPGLNGLQVAARLAKLDGAIRIVIVSMHTFEEYVTLALRAGCAGYLIKGSAATELEIAVRAVARGETYLSPAVSKQLVGDYIRRTSRAPDSLEALTPRQREILQLVAEGYTSKAIAQRLGLSYRTVESHRSQIMERLGVHDLAGLVKYAVRIGLVGLED
jgi:DNA-binding NarL/FixJ family response regulator